MDDGIDLLLFLMGVVMAVAVLLILLYCSSGNIP